MTIIDTVTWEVVTTPLDRPQDRCVMFHDLASLAPSWADWDRAHDREEWAFDHCEGAVRLRWFQHDNGVWAPLITCESEDDADLLADQWGGLHLDEA